MKVKALKGFTDLKENEKRIKGDEFVVSQDRFKEINSTKYGRLVSKVREVKPKKKSEK